MLAACRISECTFAQTGVCLENNPPDACPNRAESDDGGEAAAAAIVPPPLKAPAAKPRFPSSLTLGKAEASRLMSARYCSVIGILGSPDAGKTASLASLFMLLSRDKLSGFRFADSRTLMALNEISQGARRWNKGAPPEQMTSHTELSDDRDAGFLHLRLERTSDGQLVDFLLPDLPGEWSDTLVDTNSNQRWDFLRSADTIWLMADGRQLAGLETRRTALRRLDLLLARVAAMLDRPVRMLLVISHRDSGEPRAADLANLIESAIAKGITLEVVPIASFRKRKNGQAAAGHGIPELVEKTIGPPPLRPDFWPNIDQRNETRSMLHVMSFGEDE